MKTCSYCGKKYPDDVTVCPVDGEPALGKGESLKTLSNPPVVPIPTFNIKLVSPISRSGTYRVFVERDDLIFIRVEGGTGTTLEALAHFLGPAAILIPFTFSLLNKRRTKLKLKQAEEMNPEQLLREDAANFKLHVAEIREASIGPPSAVQISGKYGRLNLVVRHGEKFKFEFADAAGIASAIHFLSRLLYSTLKISEQWDEAAQRFDQKKK